jgi:hypothetical protein
MLIRLVRTVAAAGAAGAADNARRALDSYHRQEAAVDALAMNLRLVPLPAMSRSDAHRRVVRRTAA